MSASVRLQRLVLRAFAMCAFAAAGTAPAATFTVTNTLDSGAGSLRAAIAAANTAAGADTITFNLTGCPCAITLASPLNVTQALTITGPGMTQLALSGANSVQVIAASGGPLAISDLTIRNGKSATNGGGVSSASDLSLTRVTLQSNVAAQYGGGVFGGAKVTITDSVFVANSATAFDGGGAYVTGSLVVSGSQFLFNVTATSKGYGGGGALIAFGPSDISNSVFGNNTSADWGGAVYLADFGAAGAQTTQLTNVQFQSNVANSGGGGGGFFWFGTLLSNVSFTDNYASYRGGGAYAGYAGNYPVTVSGGQMLRNSGAGGGGLYSDSDLVVDGTLLDSNTSRNGNGGGAWTPGNATVTNATITHNTVTMGGNSGGFDTGASISLSASLVADNRTLTGGGGGTGAGGNATITNVQYLRNNAAGDGGGLLSFGTVHATGSTFTDNTAGNLGGGILANVGDVSSTQFQTNHATNNWGGGIFAIQSAVLNNATFLQNTSKFAGGAAATQTGTLQVIGGLFQGNQAGGGGFGGAIYIGGPSLTIDGTTFNSNSSDQTGGAVASNAVTITNAIFTGNTTTGTGGAVTASGLADVSLTSFRQNVAGGNGGGLWAGNGVALSRTQFVANVGASGGALYENGGGGTIVNALFSRNHATTLLGEALALKPTTPLAIEQTTVGNGTAQAAGSAIYVDGGSVDLRNSIVSLHAIAIARNTGSVNADYNLFASNGVNVQGSGVTNAHPFGGNPAFVDPALDNYHLGLGSAAIDAGPSVGVTVDYDGNARPFGYGYDLGYAESVTSYSAAQRTFVASFGNDASAACALTAPCRSLAVALQHTLPGGELVVLDAAPYDAVTISKAVSIVAAAGIYAGISALPGQSAIAIAAGASDSIALRGLTITSQGGDSGIAFYSGAALYIEGTTVRGYASPGNVDVDFQPSASARLSLKDSRVQSGATGLRITNASGEVGVEVDNVRFENNSTGIAASANGSVSIRNALVVDGSANGISLAAANGSPLTTTIDRVVVSGNGGNGVVSGGTLPVYATVRRATVRANGGTGIYASGGGSPSITRVTASVVTRNVTGVGTGSGGSILSRGDNTIEGNGFDGAPTGTYAGR